MKYLAQIISLCLTLGLLTACQQAGRTKPERTQSLAKISPQDSYRFSGKMSFSDGQDGGSGRVVWISEEGLIKASLKAPLSSQSWQVTESETGSKLTASNGQVVLADETAVLLKQQLGWPVPWEPLTHWVLGLQFEPDQSQLIWTADGFTIYEAGWEIEYSKTAAFPGGSMPIKMLARKDNYSIKLAVRTWHW